MMKTYKILFSFFLILMSGMGFSQSVPSYVPTNGLVGWWGFNGNAQDGSGNGNHGTVNGATLTTDRFGNQNSAYSFDGIDDFIQTNFLGTYVNGFAVSVWINSAFNFSNYEHKGIVYSRTNMSRGLGLIMQDTFQSSGLDFTLTFNQNGSLSYGTGLRILPNDGNWHLIVGTFMQSNNQQIYSLFMDGVQISTNSHLNSNPFVLQTPFLFGRDDLNGFGNRNWNGKLDDIGIWNRALTPQEITNLYNSQLPTQISLCLPTITTSSPTSVGTDSVVIGGDISNDGGSSIVLRGICYSTSPNPNMGNQRTEDGSGIGSFNAVLRGLASSTTYYARSYAKNSNGVVVYGNEVSFTTTASLPGLRCPGTPTVTDIDGNVYNTVQIGNQCWTQSNLKTSRYRNGDSIPTGLNNFDWENTISGAYSISNNDTVNVGLYGKLYNHYAVTDSRGLCPTGWHVPSEIELNDLVIFSDPNSDTACVTCRQSAITGGLLKSTIVQPSPNGWALPNTGASNLFGFSFLADGRRRIGAIGEQGFISNLWTYSITNSTTALNRGMDWITSDINRDYAPKHDGYSVRCLKNTLPQVNTSSVTGVTHFSALVTGEVISEGDQNTTRGFCYSTTSNPTLSNDTTMNGTGIGAYSDTLQNLTPSTTYYVRAYATNSVGTSYGSELNFTTSAIPSFTCGTTTISDVDGNTYNTVQIGTHCWTQSNLKVSKYRNGDNIPTGLNNSDWLNTVSGAFSSINNDVGNDSVYGRLYNHFATNDARGLCPTGWSVPNDNDWSILLDYVWTICGCGSFYASPLRSSNLWLQNTNGSNVTNFNATPNGMKTNWGVFNGFGSQATFWSSSFFNSIQTGPVILSSNNAVSRALLSRNSGLGVRCIKD